MNDEIEIISDGDGVALIGQPAAIDRFLASEGVPAKEFPLDRLRPAMNAASTLTLAGSQIAAHSGRWVQLTEQSAQIFKTSQLMTGSSPGVSRAIAVLPSGQTTNILEIVTKSSAMLTNPAVLAGAAGIMAQVAMQQAMDEIADYLKVIEAKVDDILRAQRDAVVADMLGVDLVIEEAMTIRAEVGRVSEITWSKVQGTTMTIARTQAYALRQLDALAEKLEKQTDVADLKGTATLARTTVQEWLAVLARCFQLQDAIAILELDRVLDASPEELDRHRLGLKTARTNRLDLIARTTSRLITRIESAAERANTKVFLNPFDARSVVHSSNHVADNVIEFQSRLGVQGARDALEAKRWRVAAVEAKDKAIDTGAAVGSGVATAATFVGRQFRSIDLDGDGVPDEARALTVAKGAGGAVAGAAGAVGGRVVGLLKRKRDDASET